MQGENNNNKTTLDDILKCYLRVQSYSYMFIL